MSKLLILCILLILVVSLLSKTANDSLEYKLQSASGEDRINTFHKLAKQYIKSSPTKSLDFAYLELGEAIIQKDRLSEARAMINIAEAYIRLDDKDKAIEYYNTAIEIFYDMNEYSSVVSGLNKLGLIYKSIGEFEKAKQYFLRSLQIEEMNVIEKMKTIYLNQSEAYTAVGNEKKALEFYKLYASLKDSLAQKYSNERLADIQKYYEMETESIQEKFEEEKNSALLKKEKAIKELESKEDQYKSQIKEIISETEKIEKKIQNLEKDRVFSNLQLQQIRTKTEMKEQEIDILKQEKKIKELELSRQRRQKTSLIIFSVLVLLIVFVLYNRYSVKKNANEELKQANIIIKEEKSKSDQLLLNILPVRVANDLKEKDKTEPESFEDVTVYFSDIVGFTKKSSELEPKILIGELNDIFTAFDNIIEEHECERIKTIGDAYMAVCGLPEANGYHAENVIKSAIEIIKYIKHRNDYSEIKWEIRIGIHTGRVVGGVVGIKKYIYDVFGNTINTASRMESNSEPMKINISETTYKLVKDKFRFIERSPLEVKGIGNFKMYFVDV